MKRLAVITDVHGNIYALKAALREINQQQVDRIFCTGDLIGIGPFSNQVCELLFSQKNIEMVTGNHDEAVLALMNGKRYPHSRINVKEHHQWIADQLFLKHEKALEKLPRTISTEAGGRTFYFQHYPMDSESVRLPIHMDPFDQIGPPNADNFASLDDLRDGAVVCFGHDHEAHHFSINERIFFNPGALGCHHEPSARYGIIELEEKGVRFKKYEAYYPLDTYLEHLKRLQFPRKEVILKIFQRYWGTMDENTETHRISSDHRIK